jgi:hypothetical protein
MEPLGTMAMIRVVAIAVRLEATGTTSTVVIAETHHHPALPQWTL